jgi:hypothetical protein
MDRLSPYRRSTLGLWRRGDRGLAGQRGRPYAEAAAHALLARLRRHGDAPALFAAYAADAEADLRLIASLVPAAGRVERPWVVRDAAFYLRWRELGGEP